MQQRFDWITLSAWIVVLGFFVSLDAQALTKELRWTHPEPDRPMMVFVIADGENIASIPVEEPDANGVFSTLVPVPFGTEVQIQVQDIDGSTSNLSNPQIYGDDCNDFDDNGDGVIGGPDWQWISREFNQGTATNSDFQLFRSVYGQRCS